MFQFEDRVPGERSCRVCGNSLLGDPEDQPFPPLGPMCGECYRAQQMDDEIEWSASLGAGDDDEDDFDA